MLIAAAAISLVGCKEDIPESIAETSHKVKIVADREFTKTTYNIDEPTNAVIYSWSTGDEEIWTLSEETPSPAKFFVFENGEPATGIFAYLDNDLMTIEAEFSGEPVSGAKYSGYFNSKVASEQLFYEDDGTLVYDQDSDVMVAAETTAAEDGTIQFCFKRLVSFAQLNLLNIEGEEVTEVKLISDNSNFAGDFNFEDQSFVNLEQEITITTESPIESDNTGTGATVVAVLLPTETQGFNITVNTVDAAGAPHTYTKDITKTITFTRGNVKGLNINFTGCEVVETDAEYVKVTSTDDITAGKYIIAAKVGNVYYALNSSSLANGKFSGSSINVSDGVISKDEGSAYELTFIANVGGWSINNGTKYIAYKSSTNLDLQDGAYKWTIETGTNGSFRLNSATSGRGCIYRAGDSNVFGGYATSNANATSTEYYDIELFKYVGATVAVTGVSVAPTTVNIEEGTTTTLTATVTPEDATDKSITWESEDTSVATVDGNGVVTAIAAGTTTITVATSDGVHTATCEVTVYAQVINEVSITEFIAAEVGGTEWYKLTGEITEIENTKYGNFNIKDATGEVYVYGLASSKGSDVVAFNEHEINVGDIITIIGKRGVHNEINEVLDAYYVSHVPAPSIRVNPTTLNFVAAGESKDVEVTVQNFVGGVTITAESSNSQFTTSVSGTTVTIVAAENTSTSDVNGTITITASDGTTEKTSEVSLTQYGKVAFVDAVDEIDRAFTGVDNGSTSYKSWSNKQSTSVARYAGNSAGNYNTIQLRSSDNAGIVSTATGGYLSKVSVDWNSQTASGRTLQVYGSNSPYSSTSDLYGSNKGTLLGTIVCGTSTELNISGEYQYIGIRSASGAMYLNKISITWSATAPEKPVLTGLTWTGYTATYTVGSTFKIDGTIKAVYSDNSEKTLVVTDVTLTAGPDLSKEGSTTAKISYTEGDITVEATASVTVNAGGGTSTTYTKVTSAPTDWSGTYIIAYVNGSSAYVYNGTDSGANNGVSVTISNNAIEEADGFAEIVIASMTGGGYSLKIVGGTNDGKYLSGGTSNGTTFNKDAVANSISMNTDGTVKINNNTTTSFQFNSASDQQRFRYFKSAQKGVTLFKK